MNSSVTQTFEVLKVIFAEANYKLLVGNFLILLGIAIIIFYSFQSKSSDLENNVNDDSTTSTDKPDKKSASATKEKRTATANVKTPDTKSSSVTPKKSSRKRTTELGQLISPDGTRSSLRLRGRTPRVFQD